jgi:hypothetical protein
MTSTETPTLADDLLVGAPAIAREVFGRDGAAETRGVYHLARTGGLPGLFKMGGLLAARKSKLRTLGAA